MTRKRSNRRGCIIIAEAGVNHNGSLALAKKLIREAARAGADYVKFQTFNPADLATASASKAGYQKKTTGNRDGQRKMLQKFCLSQSQFRLLQKECRRQGIGFLSTAFDPGSLKFVESLQPDFHKISSGDIDNLPLLRQVALYKRPVILSTGMATMGEIETALKIFDKACLPRRKVIVLQCHSEYPTSPADSNLRAIDTLRRAFKVQVGLSDHTTGITVALAAAARGACLIEKHFTLNQSMRGPDHRASLVPGELAQLVNGIREVEAALGDGVKKPSLREARNKNQVRKFLVANRQIRKGERLTSANLALKRAGGGIPASKWFDCVGKRASCNYEPDQRIRP